MSKLEAQSVELLHIRSPELLSFADRLPSGRFDTRAKDKLCAEVLEFLEALSEHDRLGAFTEVADLVYYGVKAVFNHLVAEYDVASIIASACALLDCSALDAFDVARIKYHLRAEVIQDKDDFCERQEIACRVGITTSPNHRITPLYWHKISADKPRQAEPQI